MTWAKLDDGFFRHPKARAAGKDGRALFVAGLCWAASHLTDGFIATAELGLVAAEAEVRAAPTARRLVEVGLWEPTDGGWTIHDYLLFNPTAEAEREKRRKRAEAGRKGGRKSRPPRSKAEANASANGEADEKRNGTPSPFLTDENQSSHHSHSASHPPDDDDQAQPRPEPPPVVCQAVAILAARDLADRQTTSHLPPVADPLSWENTAYKRRLAVAWPLTATAEKHPDWTAQQLADFAEPPAPTDPRTDQRNAEHARAQRAAVDCQDCCGTGWAEAPDGTVTECAHSTSA